ncbi:MAG: hypothetical protein JEZ12_25620 [Desulfobacterium sp.]|nr:hypothetical protein [Desulfobacterium sp.]
MMTDDAGAETARAAAGENRLFYRNLAMDRPQLFAAIMGFNASANWESNTHGPGLNNHGAHGLLAQSNRAKGRLYARDDQGFWDFEEESRRMALLDAPTLNECILSWGAAFCAPLINKFILKKDIEILNQDIGRKHLDFARGKGRFNIGDISGIIQVEEPTVPPEKIRALILKYGMRAHGICAAAWPGPLQTIEARRIERHLPDLFLHMPRLALPPPAHLRAIWFTMKKILLKEVAPQWTPCFS